MILNSRHEADNGRISMNMLVNLRQPIIFMVFIVFMFFAGFFGCAPAIVGTAAVGTYKGATDKRTMGTMLDDSIITAKVKSRLIASKQVSARHIDVDTLKGVVYLSGVVKTEFQKKTVNKITRDVPGVTGIRNQLAIGSKSAGQIFDDMILGSRIKAALLKQPGIRSLNIDVDVNRGIVTLTGIVASLGHKTKIIDIAEKYPETRGIIDNLKVLK